MKRWLLAVALLASCARARGPIAQRYYDAGGGDPHGQSGDEIMAWLVDRQQFARYLAGTCASMLGSGQINLNDRRNRDDLKVCLAARLIQAEPIPRDGRTF